MKDKKRTLEIFSLYDHSGLEKRLAQMAEKGWLLENIGYNIDNRWNLWRKICLTRSIYPCLKSV